VSSDLLFVVDSWFLPCIDICRCDTPNSNSVVAKAHARHVYVSLDRLPPPLPLSSVRGHFHAVPHHVRVHCTAHAASNGQQLEDPRSCMSAKSWKSSQPSVGCRPSTQLRACPPGFESRSRRAPLFVLYTSCSVECVWGFWWFPPFELHVRGKAWSLITLV
jgi:hypothetical protein